MSGSRTDADIPVDMSLLSIDALSAMAGGRHNLLSVQMKRVGEDLIRDMALEKGYDPPRKADSHQKRPKAEDVVGLPGALALETLEKKQLVHQPPLFGMEYRAGLDEWNGELEWWRRVECAVQIVGVHSRRSHNDHSWVGNVGVGTGCS